MIMYLIFNSILLIKLILFILIKIFLLPNLFSKYLVVILFGFLLYLCYKYPLDNILVQKDLFNFALKTTKAHIYNIFILVSYINIFLIGIFYLRYSNMNKQMDLKAYYILGKKFFTQYSWHETYINIIIIILFIVLYIAVIYKLTKYFKLHAIKRHVYLIGKSGTYNWYYETFHDNFLRFINIYGYIRYKIKDKVEQLYEKYYYNKVPHDLMPDDFYNLPEKEIESFLLKKPVIPSLFFHKHKNIDKFINHILTKWHYILLFFSILYDIKVSNFILIHVFSLLPWTFFYECYLRICYFKEGLWIPYDQALHNIIYSKELELINEDTLLIDGEFQDKSFYNYMYKHYIAREFIKDPKNI